MAEGCSIVGGRRLPVQTIHMVVLHSHDLLFILHSVKAQMTLPFYSRSAPRRDVGDPHYQLWCPAHGRQLCADARQRWDSPASLDLPASV